jgi:hypothetical protein
LRMRMWRFFMLSKGNVIWKHFWESDESGPQMNTDKYR